MGISFKLGSELKLGKRQIKINKTEMDSNTKYPKTVQEPFEADNTFF